MNLSIKVMHVTDGAQAFGLDTYMQAKVENLLWHPHSRHGTGSVLNAIIKVIFGTLYAPSCGSKHQQRKNEWVFSKLKQIWQCEMAQK